MLRVSTVADAERDFALKFYAQEASRDLVGNNARESRSFHADNLMKIAATIGGKDGHKN